MKIVKWWDPSTVLWEGDAGSLGNAVIAALEAGAHLRSAHLRSAHLRDAHLTGAHLRDADLTDADLTGADLTGADLTGAHLTGAHLTGAHLRGANLRDADLTGADLTGAHLRDADLRDADLRDAHLRGADLTGAHLTGAHLAGAHLMGAKHLRLPTGETWMEYLTETVPALLTAGGQSLESFGPHWDCHTWNNCPMAHAFDVQRLEEIPVLLRPRAEQFIQFFDAQQIPWPLPTKALEPQA